MRWNYSVRQRWDVTAAEAAGRPGLPPAVFRALQNVFSPNTGGPIALALINSHLHTGPSCGFHRALAAPAAPAALSRGRRIDWLINDSPDATIKLKLNLIGLRWPDPRGECFPCPCLHDNTSKPEARRGGTPRLRQGSVAMLVCFC